MENNYDMCYKDQVGLKGVYQEHILNKIIWKLTSVIFGTDYFGQMEYIQVQHQMRSFKCSLRKGKKFYQTRFNKF